MDTMGDKCETTAGDRPVIALGASEDGKRDNRRTITRDQVSRRAGDKTTPLWAKAHPYLRNGRHRISENKNQLT
jgi:hypothetical protein